MKKYEICMGILSLVCFFFSVIGCKRDDMAYARSLRVDQTDCRLCGNGKNSFSSIYGHYQGVGMLSLNDWRMIEIQPFSDVRVEDAMTSYIWEDGYSVQIEQIADRGISLVQYTSDQKNVLDLGRLSEILCSVCMENVKGSVHIYGDHDGRSEMAVCLVDLSTMELCKIQQSFQYYMFKDYYVQASCQGDKIQLTVFFTPEDLSGKRCPDML